MNKSEAIEKLTAIVSRIPSLENQQDLEESEDFKKWQHDARVILKYVFSKEKEYLKEFDDISYYLGMFSERTPPSAFQDAFRSGLRSARAMFQSRIDEITQFWPDDERAGTRRDLSDAQAAGKSARKIFIVHGHDEGAREAVARFLTQLDFEPIILHEQANRGRTVIEKVEAHSDVGFAVVLLTPDDEGCVKGGTPQPRARQNVLLELGFFVGRLGRHCVCALKRGDILEIPSDLGGVVYESFDNSGGWKQALGRELEAANFEVDWNKVMAVRR